MTKTIAITGSSGMLGAHLCAKALALGISVRAVSRQNHNAFLDRLIEENSTFKDNLELFSCDYEDREALEKAFTGCDAIIHCAAKVSFDASVQDMLASNVTLCRRVVNVALECGVKHATYISSIAAIGSKNKGRYNWGELHWNGLYGYTKFLGELEFLRAKEEGLNIQIYRPGIIVGSCMPRAPFAQMILRTIKGKIPYTSGSTGFVGITTLQESIFENLFDAEYRGEQCMVSKNLSYQAFSEKVGGFRGLKTIKISTAALYLYYVVSGFSKLFGLRSRRLRLHGIKALQSTDVYSELEGSDTIESDLKEAIKFLSKGKV